jgi:hypothetical protein
MGCVRVSADRTLRTVIFKKVTYDKSSDKLTWSRLQVHTVCHSNQNVLYSLFVLDAHTKSGTADITQIKQCHSLPRLFYSIEIRTEAGFVNLL